MEYLTPKMSSKQKRIACSRNVQRIRCLAKQSVKASMTHTYDRMHSRICLPFLYHYMLALGCVPKCAFVWSECNSGFEARDHAPANQLTERGKKNRIRSQVESLRECAYVFVWMCASVYVSHFVGISVYIYTSYTDFRAN